MWDELLQLGYLVLHIDKRSQLCICLENKQEQDACADAEDRAAGLLKEKNNLEEQVKVTHQGVKLLQCSTMRFISQ